MLWSSRNLIVYDAYRYQGGGISFERNRMPNYARAVLRLQQFRPPPIQNYD